MAMSLPLAQWTNPKPVDLSPINDGIDAIAKANKEAQDLALKQSVGQRLSAGDMGGASNELFNAGMLDQGLKLQDTAMARKRSSEEDQARIVNRAGGLAQMALSEKDPARKAAIMTRVYALDPNMQKHIADAGVDVANHDAAASYVASEAKGYRGWQDPMETESARLGMDKTRAEIAALGRRAEVSPIDAIIAQQLQSVASRNQQAQPTQQGAPTLQPQSFETVPQSPRVQPISMTQEQPGQAPAQNALPPQPQAQQPSGLQLVADQSPQAQPQAAPQDNTIDTILGRMTREQAQALGGAMILDPKRAAAGKFILDQLQGGQGALGKAGENAVDEKAINALDMSARLEAIDRSFKPEYQTYETAAKMYGLSWQDSFEATRKNMSPEQRQQLADYSKFKQDAANNLNEYIKYVTGAAMGIQEEGRIRKGVPDPDKDGPTQFEAKHKNTMSQMKLVVARMAHLKRNGYDENTISKLAQSDKIGAVLPLNDMQGIINQRLDQAAKQLQQQNPRIDPQSMKQQLRVIQRQEFGI